MGKPIQEAIALVKESQSKLNVLLAEPQHVQNLLELNALFQRMFTRLSFMSDTLEPEKKSQTDTPQFGPMTDFMGQKLEPASLVSSDDLMPKETERTIYLDKVTKLYDTINLMDPDQVLKSYSIVEEVIVLRGVAKRAGVKDYESAELTYGFVEDIQLAVLEKEEAATKQAAIDSALKKEEVLKAIRAKDPKELTQEEKDILKSNPEKQKVTVSK